MAGMSHNEVDRFAILMDVWTNEACFLENKKLVSQQVLSIVRRLFLNGFITAVPSSLSQFNPG